MARYTMLSARIASLLLTLGFVALATSRVQAAPPDQASPAANCWTFDGSNWYGPTSQTFVDCAHRISLLIGSSRANGDEDIAYGFWDTVWVSVDRQGAVYWAPYSRPLRWQFWGSLQSDSDGDGIANDRDNCPRQLETLNGIFDTDGCPDTLEDLLEFVSADLNLFWNNQFNDLGYLYRAPISIVSYTQPIETRCGPALINNAFYCAPAHSIYFDVNFLTAQLRSDGDFALVTILAHEWGHLVQGQLGLLANRFSIQYELQADCLAGAYAQHAGIAGYLEPGDLEEGANNLFRAGDRPGVPWFDPSAHGSSQQRVDFFAMGLRDGTNGCW